jgi:hypothetical protein
MIAAVVKDYDDQSIAEVCEDDWKRFCREVLVRTAFLLKDLCARHRRLGRYGMEPSTQKEWEDLRRQVAAYRWVFCGTGGGFSFGMACEDLGLDPDILREKFLSQCQPRRDINLLVDWFLRQEDCLSRRRKRKAKEEVDSDFDLVSSVREFRQQIGSQPGRRGAQSHAIYCKGGRG